MKIDIENFRRAGEAGKLGRTWSNCLMGELVGHSRTECIQAGWPEWMVDIGVWINDTATEDRLFADGLRFAEASHAFNGRNGDPDRLFRDLRLQAILPVAMRTIGDGEEPWRVICREIVQWSLDNDGQAARAAEAAGAAGAAGAARAARAAGAAEAAGAAWAAWAAEAAEAAGAACAARAARDEIFDTLCALMCGSAPASRTGE